MYSSQPKRARIKAVSEGLEGVMGESGCSIGVDGTVGDASGETESIVDSR